MGPKPKYLQKTCNFFDCTVPSKGKSSFSHGSFRTFFIRDIIRQHPRLRKQMMRFLILPMWCFAILLCKSDGKHFSDSNRKPQHERRSEYNLQCRSKILCYTVSWNVPWLIEYIGSRILNRLPNSSGLIPAFWVCVGLTSFCCWDIEKAWCEQRCATW